MEVWSLVWGVGGGHRPDTQGLSCTEEAALPNPTTRESGCQAGRQELPHSATGGNVIGMFPPLESPLSPQQHWNQPRTINQKHCFLPENKSSFLLLSFSGGRSANLRHSQCTHAYLRQVCKVPVYLLSGRCPQNIMHHTHKSFTLFFFLSFLCVVVSPSQLREKNFFFPSMILSSCCNRQPSERLSPKRSRRHWVSVWCKTACFGWNTLPPLCSGTVQPRD